MSLRDKLQMELLQMTKRYEQAAANVTVLYRLAEIAAEHRDTAEIRVKRLEDVIRDALAHPQLDHAPAFETALSTLKVEPVPRLPAVIPSKPIPIAILCPGPSLNETWPKSDQEKYGLVIAVNHALLRYDADWLCAGDLGVDAFSSDYHGRRPRVGFTCCSPAILRKVLCGFADKPGEKSWSTLQSLIWTEFSKMMHNLAYSNKSGPTSIYLARHLNASLVDVYGCDLHGDKDCNGWSDPTNCNETRWTEERKLWNYACGDVRPLRVNFISPIIGRDV